MAGGKLAQLFRNIRQYPPCNRTMSEIMKVESFIFALPFARSKALLKASFVIGLPSRVKTKFGAAGLKPFRIPLTLRQALD